MELYEMLKKEGLDYSKGFKMEVIEYIIEEYSHDVAHGYITYKEAIKEELYISFKDKLNLLTNKYFLIIYNKYMEEIINVYEMEVIEKNNYPTFSLLKCMLLDSVNVNDNDLRRTYKLYIAYNYYFKEILEALKDVKDFNNIVESIGDKLLSYKEKYSHSYLITNIVDRLIKYEDDEEIKSFIDSVLFYGVSDMEVYNFLYEDNLNDKYYEEFKKEANDIYLLEVEEGNEDKYSEIPYYDIFKNGWRLNGEIIEDMEEVNNLKGCLESYKMRVAFKTIINNIDDFLNDN